MNNCRGILGVEMMSAEDAFSMPELSDECVDAINRAAKMFAPEYPGWELYSRIVRGDTIFDRRLAAWAIGMARAYVRARKGNGHAVVAPRGRRNNWVSQAGIDALEFVITGRYGDPASVTAERLRVWHTKYQRIRGELAATMAVGLKNYQAELEHQYAAVIRDARLVA
ncbi:hypothetical protein FHW69_001618 [Luteibacter sp. Sphag1AF]|uniref:hypothetical protein n=1 Tax=Luteibacter sp. Sphag1AF TaxID=2587031 RepID=UPI00160CB47B|nr:hypothetical protein [Luteibacter sp. Sphag1AF]MBB3227017.1 hypothetical protein [Luteibacter sp. Sphag1AF]